MLTLDELGELIFIATTAWVLFVAGTVLNTGMVEWRVLTTPAETRCVWGNWQELCG